MQHRHTACNNVDQQNQQLSTSMVFPHQKSTQLAAPVCQPSPLLCCLPPPPAPPASHAHPAAAADMEDLDSQELPLIAAALADLEYRDPFLLTVLAGG